MAQTGGIPTPSSWRVLEGTTHHPTHAEHRGAGCTLPYPAGRLLWPLSLWKMALRVSVAQAPPQFLRHGVEGKTAKVVSGDRAAG